uniref:Uncharacterized protein n=1 Tax=Romanomermis culicivorax TaxID=13658 RepID=A0A915HJA5_ROMCU
MHGQEFSRREGPWTFFPGGQLNAEKNASLMENVPCNSSMTMSVSHQSYSRSKGPKAQALVLADGNKL